MINKERLLAEIEFIKGLPDEDTVDRDEEGDPTEDYWRQRTWWVQHGAEGDEPGCGSAGCLAGWALHRAGATFNGWSVLAGSLPGELRTVFAVTEEQIRAGREIRIRDAAAMYFGLASWQADDLFNQDNDAARIEYLAQKFISADEAAASGSVAAG